MLQIRHGGGVERSQSQDKSNDKAVVCSSDNVTKVKDESTSNRKPHHSSINNIGVLDSWRSFAFVIGIFFLLAIIGSKSSHISERITRSIQFFASVPKKYDAYLFVGSFTKHVQGIKVRASMEGKGISTYGIDSNTGQMEQVGIATMAGENPSYLTVHPSKNILYALNELGSGETGKVYSLDAGTPENLQVLNFQDSPGYNPSSIAVDPQGEYLVMSFFLGGGGIALYRLEEDGKIGSLQDFHTWPGTSMVHFASFDPVDGSHVLALDFGLGLIKSFVLNRENGKLKERTFLKLPANYGPRYLAWQYDLPLEGGAKVISAYISLQSAGGVLRVEFNHVTGMLRKREDQMYADCSGVADIKVQQQHLYLACRSIKGGSGGVKVQKLREDGAISSAEPLTILTDGFSTRNIAISILKRDDDEAVQLFLSNEFSDDVTNVLVEKNTLKLRSKEEAATKIASPEGITIFIPRKDFS